MVFTKGNSSISWDLGVERFRVKLIEKWSEKSFLRTWGVLSLKLNIKIWGIVWLVGVYCESDVP